MIRWSYLLTHLLYSVPPFFFLFLNFSLFFSWSVYLLLFCIFLDFSLITVFPCVLLGEWKGERSVMQSIHFVTLDFKHSCCSSNRDAWVDADLAVLFMWIVNVASFICYRRGREEEWNCFQEVCFYLLSWELTSGVWQMDLGSLQFPLLQCSCFASYLFSRLGGTRPYKKSFWIEVCFLSSHALHSLCKRTKSFDRSKYGIAYSCLFLAGSISYSLPLRYQCA